MALCLQVFGSRPAAPRSPLESAIDALLQADGAAKATWGVLIHSAAPGEGKVLYSLNAEQPFTPASNTKLLMAAAAITQHSPDFAFDTQAYSTSLGGRPGLCVQPAGDPSLTDSGLNLLASQAAAVLPPPYDDVALQLAAGEAATPATWEFADLSYAYGAIPARATINSNTVTFTVGPGAAAGDPLILSFPDAADHGAVTETSVVGTTTVIHSATPPDATYTTDPSSGNPVLAVSGSLTLSAAPVSLTRAARTPATLFASHLAEAARAARVGGTDPSVSLLARGVACAAANATSPLPVASVRSAPLSALLNHTLQQSDNLYAESLLRALPGCNGSLAAGLAAAGAALDALGVDQSRLVHVDGSGMSRHNLAPPSLFVATLQQLRAASSTGFVLRDYLPVAAESGTLIKRFVDTKAAGKVRAKTGTMTGVSALSGYVDASLFPAEVGEVTFSLLVNNHVGTTQEARYTQDKIIEAVIYHVGL